MKESYKNAGVDKEAGYQTVESIKIATKETHNHHVLNGIGDFAALYALGGYKNPVLVSGTDGVGTKIMLARTYDMWDNIGIDCFAMCANDILCHGAKPLFFLDYVACGKLEPYTAARIVKSIARACKDTGTALVGGETAEMPGMYQIGDYDVAGFCVGVVEQEHIINGKKNISPNDKIIGIASSGLHSNGYSLVRHLIKDFEVRVEDKKIYEVLLTPTKVYVNLILNLLAHFPNQIKGMAHITGGGVVENIPRIIPDELCVHIYTQQIPTQPIFKYMETYNIDRNELWNTFNMGVGFALVVPPDSVDGILQYLKQQGEEAFVMGEVVPKEKEVIQLFF